MAKEPEPADAMGGGASEALELVGQSGKMAFWALISRMTGFLRVLAIGAVLGPTYFGNLVQTLLGIPYAICELLAGSLITSLLAPFLVHALNGGDRGRAERLASGFLGSILPLFLLIAVMGALLSPWILSLVTLAVSDDSIRSGQARLGLPLLVALLPQIIIYPVIGVAIAIQHAHRSFAVPTAAQIVENLAMTGVFAGSAAFFAIGQEVDQTTISQALWIGLGSTASVLCHAAFQLRAVSRLGFRLRPSVSHRDPEIRHIVRMILPSTGLSALNSGLPIALLVVAGRFPGGAIALQMGFFMFNLPVALFARPIAAAQLPVISTYAAGGQLDAFRSAVERSTRLALFLAIFASLLLVASSGELAAIVAVGEMGDRNAIAMIAAGMAGLGVGVAAECALVVAISAAYSKHDTHSPLSMMAIRLAVAVAGIGLALNAGLSASTTILGLGLSYSASSLAAVAYLRWRIVGRLNIQGSDGRAWLPMNLAIALVAASPAYLLPQWLDPAATGSITNAALLVAGVICGVVIFLLCNRVAGSGEQALILTAIRNLVSRNSSVQCKSETTHQAPVT